MGAPEATAGLKPEFGRGAGLQRKPVTWQFLLHEPYFDLTPIEVEKRSRQTAAVGLGGCSLRLLIVRFLEES